METGTFSPLHIGWLDVLVRILAAFGFAMAVGVERFIHKKPIDFRPPVLISLSGCALAIAIIEITYRGGDSNFSIDPAKVIAGVMTGIGFLCAATVFRDDHVVRGGASAATIWISAAVGLVCGFGLIWLALIVMSVTILFLWLSGPFAGDYTIDIADEAPDDDED